MGWQDRPYNRDHSSTGNGPLWWMLYGSLPLGTWFGINVRAHATLILFIILQVLFFPAPGGFRENMIPMTILFGIVLLHEFGHCFAARYVGGDPREIIMHPLGGLAYSDIPRRASAHLVTVAGGPLVNVAICLLTGIALWLMIGPIQSLNPFHPIPPAGLRYDRMPFYLYWIFSISYILLLFNIVPVFPLDGGQLFRAALWTRIGYYRATIIATAVGIIGAGAMMLLGLFNGSMILLIVGFWCMLTSINMRRAAMAEGPWAYEDEPDMRAAYRIKSQGSSHRAAKKLHTQQREIQAEQARIDKILAKVSEHGMHSLNWMEKRALKQATENQRKREMGRK